MGYLRFGSLAGQSTLLQGEKGERFIRGLIFLQFPTNHITATALSAERTGAAKSTKHRKMFGKSTFFLKQICMKKEKELIKR